jgi:hypothetical protein
MALCQSLVNRSDDFVIREYCVDVRHPCLTQILDFCRDQSIAEAALQASCLDHANRLRTTPCLLSVMHTGVHNCVASLPTKILISHLHSLRWYESIVSYSTRLGALAQFRRITAAPAACFLR